MRVMSIVSSLLLAGCSLQVAPEAKPLKNDDHTPPAIEDSNVLYDPYLWLEEVEGDRALSWVREQNERTLASLQSYPDYDSMEAAALEIVTSDERIPYGTVRAGYVYNFWQDEKNVRGLWRRTSLDSYAATDPEWETVLDFDRLAEEEDKNWVYKGADCYRPDPNTQDYLCSVSLSDGGKDAVTTREFDLSSKQFVEDGFVTPEAKQSGAWVSANTRLIATDWGNETTTESGYPYIVKRWTRGQQLSEATELIRGKQTDVGVWPMTIELDDGTVLEGAVQAHTFFTSTYWLFPADGGDAIRWPVPPKSTLKGIHDGYMLVTLEQSWVPEGQEHEYKIGDLIAFSVQDFLDTKTQPEFELVFRPNEQQAVSQVALAKNAALLTITDNVVGRVMRLVRDQEGWRLDEISMPGQGRVGIAFSDKHEEAVFINYEGFLTPDSLLLYNPEVNTASAIKGLPEKYDTSDLQVHQHFAKSADGTRVPYFAITHKNTMLDGSTPTLLYGYGGFQVSQNPSYSPIMGRLWLEAGGAFVLANIRGGGEFGPAWHQAGLKKKRQVIYDDFIAVGEDLISRNLTSPEHLGIMGGSNGGLLMGVMLNQRPDLWDAVVVQVPLLDMLRYHKLLAGASWVGEYGSPDIADERAFLETISPYHNFDESKLYPPPFFVTSTKDDRVHPGHARKMAKKFEDAGMPFYYYENIDGGHSAAANQTERAKRSALEYAYLKSRLFDSNSSKKE